MLKTYRALAIVAVTVTVLTVAARLIFETRSVGGWFAETPFSPTAGILPSYLFATLLPSTMTIAAPIVSTFGGVVAAQGRHWGWLGAFIALGLLGVYGGSAFVMLGPYLGVGEPLRGPGLALDIYVPIILLSLPAVAALLFVALTARGQRRSVTGM